MSVCRMMPRAPGVAARFTVSISSSLVPTLPMCGKVKVAMKSRAERQVSTLRMMNAAIKDKDIEARGLGKGPLSDEELLALFQKMIKQRQESVELYVKGAREELAAQEREEIEIITSYL